MKTLIKISDLHDSDSHVRAVTVIAHLTRHGSNIKPLVYRAPRFVATVVRLVGRSPSVDARSHGCRVLRNLAGDPSCRYDLAYESGTIENLCLRARKGGTEERGASIGALKNLASDPRNMIPMANAHDCLATLIQMAHGGGGGGGGEHRNDVTEDMQYLACDALAMLSHWMRRSPPAG